MNEHPTRCISLYAENRPGVLGRVTAAFTRRHVNIESLLVSASGVEGLHRFTVGVRVEASALERIALHLERQVDVVSVHVHPPQTTSLRALSLFRLPAHVGSDVGLQAVVRRWAARFVHADDTCTVLEFTGLPEQSEALLHALRPWTVLEYANTGALALEHTSDSVAGEATQALRTKPATNGLSDLRTENARSTPDAPSSSPSNDR
jgi:acetolactate synthase-1/3 small subunit